MIAIEHLQALTQLLAKQTTSAQQLLNKLQQEHEVLISADTDMLNQIVTQKQTLIQQLESGMTTINQSLSGIGLDADKAGIHSLLQSLPDNTPLHQQWEKLQQLARECQERNEINGGIVTLKQRHVRQAMDILKGGPSNENTYGKAGEVSSSPALNSYTKA